MTDQDKKPAGTFTLICTTVLFLPCMLLSRLAAQTWINVVTIDDTTVSKHRTWYSNFIRIPGNLVLGFRRAPVKVLSTKQWHERERQLSDATVVENKLQLAKLGGVPLSEYLSSEKSAAQKLAAINAATHSLFNFHFQHDQSHGDASSSNVMINESPDGNLSAIWFDFDVAHRDSVPDVVGRSDDLRALFFTSKPWLTDNDFARLFAGSDSPYTDDDVWKELIKAMSNPIQHCDIFHLAQQKRAIHLTSEESSI